MQANECEAESASGGSGILRDYLFGDWLLVQN
jgi:hypothetical protein